MKTAAYIHGTDDAEQDRLAALNRLTNASFVEFLGLGPAARVLEVGSGLGILAAEVAARVPMGEVVGLEYSAAQLARADEGLMNARFVQGDAHALPFDDDSFDVVYARYVLEHLADPARALAEMRRVLRPNGRVFLQENDVLVQRFDPEVPAFERVWSRFVELQRQLGGDALIGRRLFVLLRRAGFRDVELSIAPEVHWHGSAGFAPWVENLAGNVRGATEALLARELCSQAEVGEALAELEGLVRNDEASGVFYWNRATATK